ncbi:OpgC domain-containing protein [Bosea psychrotolerans]|uniref:OpgC protein n=1 Tax=Bosea psychrotolerans TaxID=1871628 RepID=A0A2S4MPU6_9HYPH|nr:OpgC domain-containing protein [Bosea psychrotolerans]POR56665.1 hypothetical protein CYD53_101186 [Bosea psychrotolerans]
MSRIHSIDAARGLCLLNIFINHITLGFSKEISFSKLGLSDAAEIFVLVSGVSTYLFYGTLQIEAMTLGLWRRAIRLYFVNAIIVLSTLGVIMSIDHFTGDLKIFDQDIVDALRSNEVERSLWLIFSFQQSVGYSVVLKLYMYFMLLCPALIWLSSRTWWYSLPPAVLIWAVAGQFDLVPRNSLTGEPFALTILPWTLIFTCGIALGAAIKQGVEVPQSRFLKILAFAYVLGYVVFVTLIAPHWPAAIDWFATRNDHFWLGGSKTYQSPLRLLHALSLVYLFISCPGAPLIRLLHQANPRGFLCRMGRRSLPIFAFGAVVSVAADEALFAAQHFFGARSLPSIAVELVFVALGIAAMIAIADRRWPFQRPNRIVAEQPISP